jgi:ribonuclease-3
VSRDLKRLASILGCGFDQERLLVQALTHRSAQGENNERLEFVGDALLGFVIAEALWERLPNANEGKLSRLRASLVKRESLAALARGIHLGEHVRLGTGEMRSGGHTRESILADALEAVFAAVYMDRGFDTARNVILALFSPSLSRVAVSGASKDPKTRLQELLQADKRSLPVYEVERVSGRDHVQRFYVRCMLGDSGEATQGEGTSRRRAEQQAAERMLNLLAADANDAV